MQQVLIGKPCPKTHVHVYSPAPPSEPHRKPTLSVSAMKNMLSVCVDISKAFALLIVSSAPLIERHLFTCVQGGGEV